jgi:hypothetical protein
MGAWCYAKSKRQDKKPLRKSAFMLVVIVRLLVSGRRHAAQQRAATSGRGVTEFNASLDTENITTSDTLTGHANDTGTDSFRGSGTETWSLRLQGTFPSLASVVYQDAGALAQPRPRETQPRGAPGRVR